MEGDDETQALEVRLLLEGIYEKYGYDLREYAGASIRRRVSAALAKSGLPNLGELQHKALIDPGFFSELLHGLTVQVSEIFRDPEFYCAFRARVLPILRTYPSFRIWHAGCATGEEAYATAILLTEEGLYDRAQIYATDVSPHALEHAKQGVYGADRLPVFAKNYTDAGGKHTFSSYYTSAYDRIAFHESLRRNILFFQHNLVSDYVFGEMHVIFCRNVLIYFSSTLKRRVLQKFAEALAPGGFLCLGTSEQIPRGEAVRRGETARGFSEFAAERHIYQYARL